MVNAYVLIMCGGGGTRLWPSSRKKTPKQFLKLLGDRTLFSQTIDRAKKITSSDKIFIVTNADYVDEILALSDIPVRNVIAEPMARNTALAMAVGAAYIRKTDKNAVIVNFWSDNLISSDEKLLACLNSLTRAVVENNCLGAIGLKPTFPHTGLGYIEVGEKMGSCEGKDVYRVNSFLEKPQLEKTKEFVASGQHYWNIGLYAWPVEAFIDACQKYAPKIFKGIEKIEAAIGEDNERSVVEEVYREADDISIDYAISEKVDKMILVPADFGWSDVGDWSSIWDLGKKDDSGNVVISSGPGELFMIESKNNVIQSGGRFVGLVGLEHYIVIDTKDALLICRKDRAQDVKKVVEYLKANNIKDLL